MSEGVSADRGRAARVAKWLVDQGKPGDAVLVLCAWAANGPNDSAGQELLADALRIDPASEEAQLAFERMEGIAGDHSRLDAALQRFSSGELLRMEAEIQKPTFRRAQMGFNNNLKSKGQAFHVQTEDSGLDSPHIITHLFADGGRVVKSHKRDYSSAVQEQGEGIGEWVRNLMKAQHMEMVLALRDGRFDAILDGTEVGGLEELTEPPREDVIRRLNKGKRSQSARDRASQAPQTQDAPAPDRVVFTLRVLRSLAQGPERYDVTSDIAVIGSRGLITLPGERFCHPEEAVVTARDGALFIEDLEGGNGVFLRIRTPAQLEFGDEFMVGDQLLKIEENPEPNDGPDPHPTYFYSSPKWPSSFRVVQIFEGGATGACVVARGNTLQIGAVIGDLVFSDDPLVDDQHCIVEEAAGSLLLTDLNSRTGLFVRATGEHELQDGDELVVGRTHLSLKVRRA